MLFVCTEGLCEDGEKPVIKVEPELKKRAIKRSRNDEQGTLNFDACWIIVSQLICCY